MTTAAQLLGDIELKCKSIRKKIIKMNTIKKWQRTIESSKQKVQKRQDTRDLRNSNIYANGKDHYLDADGYYRDDIEIPHWFKNLQKAWKSNRELRANRKEGKINHANSVVDDWHLYCDNRVEMFGEEYDPRTQKRKPGRPKLPDHLKKNPTKIKRSDKMKQLLKDNGITVKESGDLYTDTSHYIGWKFQINGRVRFEDEDAISVHKFLTLI